MFWVVFVVLAKWLCLVVVRIVWFYWLVGCVVLVGFGLFWWVLGFLGFLDVWCVFGNFGSLRRCDLVVLWVLVIC